MKTIFFLFLLFPNLLFSQKQERQIIVYNVAFGSLSSGIGSVINKPKNSDWKKYFLKGVWQGAIGGFLNYSGKKTLYLINKKNEPGFGWPAKILHAAGTSIIENAALNEPFLQNWNIDIGPVRFDYSVNHEIKFRARFLPISIYAFYYGNKYGKFDFKTTIKTGNMAFKNPVSLDVDGNNYDGYSFSRAFIILDEDYVNKNKILSHELTHLFQYRDFLVLNTWLKPLEKKVKSKSIKKIFTNYIYLDIPYFWPIYQLEGMPNNNNYFKNFFEFEAARIATNRYVPR